MEAIMSARLLLPVCRVRSIGIIDVEKLFIDLLLASVVIQTQENAVNHIQLMFFTYIKSLRSKI